ncbi:response regulator transcription factor [Paenibacillus nasutitermitis]|uniref:DNA-binding response regulator n=1 Tax=Paenibacillus nasutitermitis TaxID=1652958 RepID=A0A916ZA13_9BACL|nr:response regulator [Paenibacillus nasutitermitis]GGD83575.1 DNA-binding response regulator [Paenibacillus nasutitermitis]
MYKLLIVDDEPQILEGMKRILDWKSYGFEHIETCNSTDAAVSRAIQLVPDIAIFDVCIGKSRGYDAIQRLNEANLPTKYIIMSGYSDFHFAQQAIRCGVKDYLLKPVEREKLQQLVENIIVKELHGTIGNQPANSLRMDPVLGVPYDTLSKLVRRILLMVTTEYAQNITLKSVAERLQMNSTYLGQLFIKETQMKLSEYLMIYRMQRAKEFILSTNEKIQWIAGTVGYNNLNYFYTHFQSYFGQSPSDLREKS